MSEPKVVHGGYFDVQVDVSDLALTDSDGDALSGFVTLCGLTSKTLTHQFNTSDQVIPPCGNPEAVPHVSRIVNSQEKNIAGTGLHNRGQTNIIRAILGKTLTYRFVEGEPGNDLVSQGYWEGPFLFSNWQEGATDYKGNVTSQFAFASDGEVNWFSTTAPALVALTLGTSAATAGSAWTSTVTGLTANSTLGAVAADGTVLTVTDGSISGTFETAGTVSVTLTEINPEASNSPKVTTVSVTVS